MEEKIKLIRNRELNKTYIIIYTIKNEIKIKLDEKIVPRNLYTLIGIDNLGNRNIIDIVIENENNSHFWLDTFETIKSRGVEKIFFLSISTNTNINRAIKITFPDTIIVISLTDVITSMYKYVSYRGKSCFIKYVKELCIQNDIKDFNYKYNLLKEHYNDNYIVTNLIENKLIVIKQYYKYDINIRKLLFNHYKSTKIYDKINKYNDNSYIKNINDMWEYLYEYITTFEQFKSYTKKNWTDVLNSFINLFPESIKELIRE